MSPIESVQQILLQVKPELVRKYHVKSIGLFGSIVRDDYVASKSDVDIIVEFSRPVGIEFIDLADFLELKIKHKVDLVSRNGIKGSLYNAIEPEIIYV